MNRREFLEAGAGFMMLKPPGSGGESALPQTRAIGFDDYGLLLGADSARPESGSRFLGQYQQYDFIYWSVDTGNQYWINSQTKQWREIAMPVPTNQLDEVETADALNSFNHTFARPEAPDFKNWSFTDADVTKFDSEIELVSTTVLETTQWGNYPPGSEATPGTAQRVTGAPSAGEALSGYFNSSDGGGIGEDATDTFVFLRKGGTEKRVYRNDWNGFRPNERLLVSSRPVITRFPHLFYGGGDFRVRALVHGQEKSTLQTLHTFTPDNVDDTFSDGPPLDQPNLPVRFETDGLTGGNLRANACHYQYSLSETENRINGEIFGPVDVGTTGWTPLIAWRKEAGWDMVNVKPLKIKVVASAADAKLELQLSPTLSGGTWRYPTHTSSSETAVEVNTGVSLDANGERRWPGYAVSGQGSKTGDATATDLDFNLASGRDIVLAAQGVGGTATCSGVVGWEEFF